MRVSSPDALKSSPFSYLARKTQSFPLTDTPAFTDLPSPAAQNAKPPPRYFPATTLDCAMDFAASTNFALIGPLTTFFSLWVLSPTSMVNLSAAIGGGFLVRTKNRH